MEIAMSKIIKVLALLLAFITGACSCIGAMTVCSRQCTSYAASLTDCKAGLAEGASEDRAAEPDSTDRSLETEEANERVRLCGSAGDVDILIPESLAVTADGATGVMEEIDYTITSLSEAEVCISQITAEGTADAEDGPDQGWRLVGESDDLTAGSRTFSLCCNGHDLAEGYAPGDVLGAAGSSSQAVTYTFTGAAAPSAEAVAGQIGIMTIEFGENLAKLRAFTIDGTDYYAEEGMTYKQWAASDYNTAGLAVSTYNGLFSSVDRYVYKSSNDYVLCAGGSGISVIDPGTVIGEGDTCVLKESISFTYVYATNRATVYSAVKGMTLAQWKNSSMNNGVSIITSYPYLLDGTKLTDSYVLKDGATYYKTKP